MRSLTTTRKPGLRILYSTKFSWSFMKFHEVEMHEHARFLEQTEYFHHGYGSCLERQLEYQNLKSYVVLLAIACLSDILGGTIMVLLFSAVNNLPVLFTPLPNQSFQEASQLPVVALPFIMLFMSLLTLSKVTTKIVLMAAEISEPRQVSAFYFKLCSVQIFSRILIYQ